MKKYFITGLLVWVPLGITLWVLNLTIGTMDRTLLLLPEHWQPDRVLGIHIPGLGIILTLVVVGLTGLLVRNVLGQRVLYLWEGVLQHIPFVNSIYKGVKQVSDTLLSGSGKSFRKVLLVRYPHPECMVAGVPDQCARRSDRQDGRGIRCGVHSHHAEPGERFLFLRAQSRHHSTGYDSGRGAALHRLDGRGGGFRTREDS